MAHLATNRFNYWAQLGVLAAFCGAGLIIGGMASFIPLIGKIDFFHTKNNAQQIMDQLLVPENAVALRISQFISTTFLFFLPPVLYARLCHVKAFTHLGFKHSINFQQVGLVLLIMLASLPAVGALQQLTEMLPWSKATLLQFKNTEAAYNKQIAVIARMDTVWDYISSLIVIALLPALFEETLFRGAIQNLFSRWFKMPLVAIVATAIIFSAVHGSYLGFLSRFALGAVLGYMFYLTGNIWLNIIAHFFNNALALTYLYFSTKPGEKIDPSKIEEQYPLWIGLVSIAVVVGLFMFFINLNKNKVDHPGEEVLMTGYNFNNNPFLNNTFNQEHNN